MELWSNIANKLDPRVDADTYGLRNTGVSTGPTGTAGDLSNSTNASAHNVIVGNCGSIYFRAEQFSFSGEAFVLAMSSLL